MKLFFDFFPILLFFVVYKAFDIYIATAVAIAATSLLVAVSWFRTRKVGTMQLVTLAVITVFGGLTLYLHDEQFIKWKPTVINWLFGGAFLATQLFGQKTAIERLMGASINLPGQVWRRLNLSWVAFFFVMGSANLYVMYHFDRDTWVNFKLFGMLGMTFFFMILQSFYLSRFLTDPSVSE